MTDHIKICESLGKDLNVRYDITSDHLTEIRNIGGCVTGSIVLKHIMKYLHNIDYEPNDIDIIVPIDKSVRSISQIKSSNNNFIYRISNDLTLKLQTSSSEYMMTGNEDLLTTNVLIGHNIKINILHVRHGCNVLRYINNFDLGCCKNYYDGLNLVSFEYDHIKLLGTTLTYNKHNLTSDNTFFVDPKSRSILKQSFSRYIRYTYYYAKYRTLLDIHTNVITPKAYSYTYDNRDNSTKSCKYETIDTTFLTKSYIDDINQYFPIKSMMDEVYAKAKYIVYPVYPSRLMAEYWILIQEDIDIMNMIKCYDRLQKYKTRGIAYVYDHMDVIKI